MQVISVHKEVYKMIELAKRHVGFDQRIVDTVLEQDSAETEYKATKESRKLYELARQVGSSVHKTEAFTRLDINEKGILFTRIDPKHYIEDIVADFFAERFPMYIIVLESRRGCFVKKKGQRLAIIKDRMESVIAKLEKNFDGIDILCDLLDFDDRSLLRVFYSSANIMERKNKRYFLRNVPKKYYQFPGLAEEKSVFDGNHDLMAYE